jgi:hypothetical protein
MHTAEGYTCIPTDGTAPGGSGGSGAQFTLNWWDQCGGMGGNCNKYQCLDGAFPNYACPSGEWQAAGASLPLGKACLASATHTPDSARQSLSIVAD